MGTGQPCFGCSEKGVGFTKPIPEQASLKYFTPSGLPKEGIRPGGAELRLTPPTAYAPIEAPEGHGVSATAVGVAAGLAGLAAGAAAATALKLGKAKSDSGPETKKE